MFNIGKLANKHTLANEKCVFVKEIPQLHMYACMYSTSTFAVKLTYIQTYILMYIYMYVWWPNDITDTHTDISS